MTLPYIDVKDIKGPVCILPLSCMSFVVYHLLRRHGVEVSGFCDNNQELSGKQYDGVPVKSPGQACAENPTAAFIVVSYKFRKDLADQMKGLGAENILYTGQFLNRSNFEEAWNYVDEVQAGSLVPFASPKLTAQNQLPCYCIPEPTFDKNLVVRSMNLFFTSNEFPATVESLKKALNYHLLENADFIPVLRILLHDNAQVSPLADTIRLIRETNLPIGITCIHLDGSPN